MNKHSPYHSIHNILSRYIVQPFRFFLQERNDVFGLFNYYWLLINIKNTDTWKRLKIKLLKYHDITLQIRGML